MGLSPPNMKTLGNVSFIVIGVIIASFGEIQFVMIGFLLQVAGIVFEAIRLTMVQRLLSSAEFKMDPLVSLYYFAPACTIMNGVIALIVEVPNMGWADFDRVGYFTLLLNAMVAFGLNVSVVFLVCVYSANYLCAPANKISRLAEPLPSFLHSAASSRIFSSSLPRCSSSAIPLRLFNSSVTRSLSVVSSTTSSELMLSRSTLVVPVAPGPNTVPDTPLSENSSSLVVCSSFFSSSLAHSALPCLSTLSNTSATSTLVSSATAAHKNTHKSLVHGNGITSILACRKQVSTLRNNHYNIVDDHWDDAVRCPEGLLTDRARDVGAFRRFFFYHVTKTIKIIIIFQNLSSK